MSTTSIPTPYKINVPQSKIDTLRSKLSTATFPTELENAGWDMGTPLAEVKRLAQKWQTWDWRAAEKKLNELPMFEMKVPVDGFGELDMHFVWVRSGVPNAIPLLFVHGWPGSFIEVTKLISDLSNPPPGSPAFDIIAPSLPNFGFSSAPTTRGFGLAQYAQCLHNLMLALSYPQYITQGGDWGFFITRAIGYFYPSSCKASHINMILARPPSFSRNPIWALRHKWMPYTEKEKRGIERGQWFDREGKGYNTLQSTKPQTLAYALEDSPVALLAWIMEKLHDWTDGYPWTDDEILTWISIYAFSKAGPAAAHRIYYETMHTPSPPPSSLLSSGKPGEVNGKRVFTRAMAADYVGNVPLGIAHNPKELYVPPKSWAHTLGKVVHESFQENGGHFCAWERPDVVVGDLRGMVGKGGGCFGVVEGRDGYFRGVKAML